MFVHWHREFLRDRETRGRVDHPRCHTSDKAPLAVISPPRIGRHERRKTIEASATGAGLHLSAVQNAMLGRRDMSRIEAVRTRSEREGGS